MSEVHINPIPNTSVVFHNPGQAPAVIGAGQPVVATAKTVGQPNGAVSGQVAGTSCIVRNPA